MNGQFVFLLETNGGPVAVPGELNGQKFTAIYRPTSAVQIHSCTCAHFQPTQQYEISLAGGDSVLLEFEIDTPTTQPLPPTACVLDISELPGSDGYMYNGENAIQTP